MSAQDAWVAYMVALWIIGPGAIIVGSLSEIDRLAAGGVVVLGAWAIGEAFVLASGDYAPWGLYLAMDGAAALFFLWRGNACSIALGLTFAAQVALHLTASGSDELAYWWSHAATGFVQLGVLAGWVFICPRRVIA